MPLTTLFIVIAAFVILNGLFVAAEFALVGAARPTIADQASKGDSFARRLLAILRSPARQDRYIATSQIGITIAFVLLCIGVQISWNGVQALIRIAMNMKP